MLYIVFDGTGYRPALAGLPILAWDRIACVGRRDPNSSRRLQRRAQLPSCARSGLTSRGRLKKVHGRYLGAWNAYPGAGYEQGAAVIGLAWSSDLLHWELTDPILFPADGAPWEHGGLDRPNLIEHDGVYYLYYNAKTDPLPKSAGGGWREQSGVATSRDLRQWTRYQGNPILPNGGPDTWDARFASNPFVVRHDRLWGMYYFGFDRHGAARELLALGRDPSTSRRSPRSSSIAARPAPSTRPSPTSPASSITTERSTTSTAPSPASGRTKSGHLRCAIAALVKGTNESQLLRAPRGSGTSLTRPSAPSCRLRSAR